MFPAQCLRAHVIRPKAIKKRISQPERACLSAPGETLRNRPHFPLYSEANLATISPSTVDPLWMFPHVVIEATGKINIIHSRRKWVDLVWGEAVLRSLREHKSQSFWRHLGFSELWRSLSFRGDMKGSPKLMGLLRVESCMCGNVRSPGKEHFFHPAARFPS